MRKLIELYLERCRARGLSANTLKAYSRDLASFIQYAGSRRNYKELIQMWIRLQQRKGVSAATVSRRLTAVKTFFRYLVNEGYIQRNPVAGTEAPKIPRRLPKPLTEADISKLLNEAKRTCSARDLAIVELLYSTGMRVSELTCLKMADICLEKRFVTVYGKGSRERLLPLGMDAIRAILSYLESRPESQNGLLLFLNHFGRPLRPKTVQRLLRGLGESAGIESRVTPHVLRHSYATHMLDHGCDLRTLQELLGHQDISTTQKYTAVSTERKVEAVSKFHPRGNMKI